MKDLDVDIPETYIEKNLVVTGNPVKDIVNRYANHPSIRLINENVIRTDFSFNTVTLSEVETVVASLNGNKATSENSIPIRLLKKYGYICNESLTSIINKGIQTSTFDSSLKLADVIPVHKAEETTNKKIIETSVFYLPCQRFLKHS